MLFNSYEYIFFFLPATFAVYFYLNKKRQVILGQIFLVASSLFFYAWWNIAYLPILISSIFFNFSIGRWLILDKFSSLINKKCFLIGGIIGNLALLGYFKYSDFLVTNLNDAFNLGISSLNLALPLAISFFSFQQIAYLIDSYRGEAKEYDLLNYTVFVSFFPQLIAGPIVHHREMMPQFANLKNKLINYKNIAFGLFIFSIGFFKKTVIADNFAVWASHGFDNGSNLNLFEAWGTSLSYTFQLYFDFSGYADMAIGAALLFNIKIPVNFNSPYKALDIQDFWRRWHITLSKFLRDYVYFSLGGNRNGDLRAYGNILMTFLIAGLWHGASWMFVLWGGLHGLALIIHRAWKQVGLELNDVLSWFITFNFVNFTWVFFRAKEFPDAIRVLKGMVGMGGIALPHFWATRLDFLIPYGVSFGNMLGAVGGQRQTPLYILVFLFVVVFCKNSNQRLDDFKSSVYSLIYVELILIISFFFHEINEISEFIYFNF
jgi:alginate O-acetyltransferase complex protein AlgI